MTKTNKIVDIQNEVEKANKLITKLELKTSTSLQNENEIRKETNLELVKKVTLINKLPKLDKKHGKRMLNNSYDYYLSSYKITFYKEYIKNLNNPILKNDAKRILNGKISTLKNFLNDQYDDYEFTLLNNNIQLNKNKTKNYSKSLQAKHNKDVKKENKRLANLQSKIKELFSDISIEEIPQISSIKILSYNMPNLSKEEQIKLKEVVKQNNLKVDTLYKYYICKAKLTAYSHFNSNLKKNNNNYLRTINEQQELIDSLSSQYNYEISKYYKEQELKFLENLQITKNKEFDNQLSAYKLSTNESNENNLIELENEQKQLQSDIQKMSIECNNLPSSSRSHKKLQLSIALQHSKLEQLTKEIEYVKENIDPSKFKQADKIYSQKHKFNKSIKQKQKNAGSKKHAFSRLLELIKPFKVTLILICGVIVISSLCQIASPVLINTFLSEDFLHNFVQDDGKVILLNVIKMGITMITIYLFIFIFNFLTEFITSKLGGLISYSLRNKVKTKIDRLPLSYFDQTQIGDLLSKVTNDIDLISSSIHTIISESLKAAFLLVCVVTAMFVVQWQLAFIAIATIPFALIVVVFIAMKSQKEFIKVQKITGKLNAEIEEIYSGFKVVKLYNQESKVNFDFSVQNTRLQRSSLKSQFLSGCIMPLMNAIHYIAYALICVVGGVLGAASTIVSFMIFLNQFQMPIQQMSQISSTFQQTFAASNRVFEIIDSKEEIPDTDESIIAKNIHGEVSFENVKFSYNPENPLIEDLNLKVNKGDSIAIVGPTGAGKTTLVNLIMRFYDVTGGSLKIDDVDIRDYDRNSIRKRIGMVLQDTWLFNGTIAENIAYGKHNATMEEIIDAAKRARVHHFILTLENGYDTIINEEGTNISQGQKQLLTIARAIISNPEIMILDEATSSVDTRTEKALQDAMQETLKNRTSFVIAHRLSTIKNSKLILVMNKGHIVEQGNHEELLKKGGFYADLYNAQFLGTTNDTSTTNS